MSAEMNSVGSANRDPVGSSAPGPARRRAWPR